MVIDANHLSTTLSWDVQHARSVAFQGGNVPAKGSSVQKPEDTTTYQLVATWVDGSTLSASPVMVNVARVRVHGYSVDFHQASGGPTGVQVKVTLEFTVENATGGSINNASMMYSDRHHWFIWGHHWQSTKQQNVRFTLVRQNTWQCTLSFDIDRSVVNYGNVGFQFDYGFQGFMPTGQLGQLQMWRGQFNFWNGS